MVERQKAGDWTYDAVSIDNPGPVLRGRPIARARPVGPGLERHGKKQWRRDVSDVVARLIAALEPDDTVLGGGNVKKLEALPSHCRADDNANAFRDGFRLWEEAMLSRAPELIRVDAHEG